MCVLSEFDWIKGRCTKYRDLGFRLYTINGGTLSDITLILNLEYSSLILQDHLDIDR